MADLTKPIKIGTSGGLHARLAQARLAREAMSEAFNPLTLPNRIAIMIDQSGSMGGYDEENPNSKIRLLENALQDFITKSNTGDTSLAIESFPAGTRFALTNEKLLLWTLVQGLKAGGGTPMSEAMEFCLKSYPLTRGIIISDGDADFAPRSITEQYARKEIKIDCVHIGDSSGGESTLREIAEKTGGLFIKFKDVKSFSEAFQFLLPEHRQNAARLMLTAGASEVR